MADLFDPSCSPPPPSPPHTSLNFALESDDISSLLYTLLQNSSQISTSCPPAAHEQQPAAAPEERRLFARSGGFSHRAGILDLPSGLNFRFAGGFYSSGADEPAENVSGSIGLSMEGIGEVECESQEQEEVRADPPPVRSSSKRSRAAEVHNLSEKRRRQKINEKMKALQKLIPNSNKTDKASMLDEAIEYLKQLQLQVQMLTLRNGSGLHPFYLPVTSPPVQSPQMPSLLGETNGRKVEAFPSAQEASVQTVLDLACKPASSDYKILIPKTSENNNSGSLFVTEPSTNAYYRRFNARMPSKLVFLQKGLCKDAALPQSHLDMNQGQSSSSGPQGCPLNCRGGSNGITTL